MHSPSTTPLVALIVFPYSNAKDYYRLFKFVNGILVNMQPEVLNFLNQKFYKPQVLKDETKLSFKNFVILIGYINLV